MAIGVFDSGVGGLTVHRELTRRFPDRDFLYLADQAHAPYGGRGGEEIVDLTRAGCERLFEAGANVIVLACNTASAIALRRLQQTWVPEARARHGRPINVLGIIVPTIEAATGLPWTYEAERIAEGEAERALEAYALVPELFPERVLLGVGIVTALMLGNLRGVRESGTIFMTPTYLYIGAIGSMLVIGLVRLASGDLPEFTPPTAWLQGGPEGEGAGLEALGILLRSLGPEHASDELLGVGMAPFFYLPHVLFVAERGLEHFDLSMHAQYELTKRFSVLSMSTQATIELMIMTAVLYLAMSYPMSLLSRRLEEKMGGSPQPA